MQKYRSILYTLEPLYYWHYYNKDYISSLWEITSTITEFSLVWRVQIARMLFHLFLINHILRKYNHTTVVLDVRLTADRINVGLQYNVTMTCRITRINANVVDLSFSWTRTQKSDAFPLIEQSNTLVIHSVTREDIASYTCQVSNKHISERDTIRLFLWERS